ncbi:nucleobase-ascorbate transporter 3-like [Hibiscus syriacus]|uniref:nucleobase-ascorbate transporter 3-like n=1 Tax=Hibiscus syriacus TaxID=106335 RepID=UPI001921019C|nr:nucleobase-ascorbate transporter 3-like [Hibiscus syriacus]
MRQLAASGITFIQFANNNSMRNIYVLGVSLFLGLSIPQYFAINTSYDGHGPVRTNAIWFNDIMNTIFSLPATVAITVGTILDNTLEANQVEDRGVPWWKPFQHSKGDVRTEEFYSYPLRLNEYICSPGFSNIVYYVQHWRICESRVQPFMKLSLLMDAQTPRLYSLGFGRIFTESELWDPRVSYLFTRLFPLSL